MKAYLSLLRVNVCILAVLATIVGALVSKFFSMNEIIIASVVAFLICGAGNVLNDYFDYKIDKINKPNRPMPSGKVKLKTALIYALLLFLIGNVIAILYLNYYMIALAVINTMIIILYDWKIKGTPVGHFLDSYIGSSPFLFGGLLSGTIMFPVLILFLLGFFGNVSREIFKGMEDIVGDRKAGIKTLEIAIGIKRSRIIAIISLVIALILTPLPYLEGFVSMYYIPPVVLADLLIIYTIIRSNDAVACKKMLKIIMFVILFAFLTGLI